MNSRFTTLTSVNKSQYDDSYYASIDPDALRQLVSAIDSGNVQMNKNGKVSLKGWKNESQDGGQPYISLKWSAPMDQQPAAQQPAAQQSAPISNEDIPF